MVSVRHLEMKTHHQPDIRFFQSYKHRGNLLAKFDYMGVLPTLKALETQLRVHEMMRRHGARLTREELERGQRAFLAIRNDEYVTEDYPWKDIPTDCYWTTHETWWEDLMKKMKTWD